MMRAGNGLGRSLHRVLRAVQEGGANHERRARNELDGEGEVVHDEGERAREEDGQRVRKAFEDVVCISARIKSRNA